MISCGDSVTAQSVDVTVFAPLVTGLGDVPLKGKVFHVGSSSGWFTGVQFPKGGFRLLETAPRRVRSGGKDYFLSPVPQTVGLGLEGAGSPAPQADAGADCALLFQPHRFFSPVIYTSLVI